MVRIHRSFAYAACLCLIALISHMVPATAGELRIALIPPATPRGSDAAPAAVAQFLDEWLGEQPSVRLVTRERAVAIAGALTNGALSLAPEAFFPAMCALQPMDACVDFSQAADAATLRLHSARGVATLPLAPSQLKNFRTALTAARDFVRTQLALPEVLSACNTPERFESDAYAMVYYSVPFLWAPWPQNPGEERLKRLAPFWSSQKSNPALAARILDATALQLSGAKRDQSYTPKAIPLAQDALPQVLGTPFEASGIAAVSAKPEAFESTLLAVAERALADDTLSDAEPAENTAAAPSAPQADPLGAVRLLGSLVSPQSAALLEKLLHVEASDVRAAAMAALCERTDAPAKKLRATMTADPDTAVAFLAQYGVWTADRTQPAPVAGARACAAKSLFPEYVAAVLGAQGTAEDIPALRALIASRRDGVRRAAYAGLLRLQPDDAALRRACLDDIDSALIRQTLQALGKNVPSTLLPRLTALCNDPQAPLCEAARLATAPTRPSDTRQAQLFNLATEHPWVRQRILEAFHHDTGADTLAALRNACSNANPRTRTTALELLADRDAAAGRSAAVAALADPHRRVRLVAAALLHRHATATEQNPIDTALATEKDTSVRSYLAATADRLAGRPATVPAAARRVADRPGLTWMCGMGTDAATSPYSAYYCLSTDVNDRWKAAYAADKVCFGRISTVGAPGLVLLDPAWEDAYWIAVEKALKPEDLLYVDGIVYGEETMDFKPDALWDSGWRLFCLDAHIDPTSVSGDMTKLTPVQRKGWKHWASERQVDGFNILHDDTKLRWGLLRPGLQIATFMPEQALLDNGPNPAALRWKFDVGGIYDYKGSSRQDYFLIRRQKTLWPDRPIIWLSLGIGGYEMNPVKYSLAAPVAPLTARGDRVYADTVSAWLAGADAGWFSTWIFVRHDYDGNRANLSGVQILLEDIAADNPLLNRGIDLSFRDTEKLLAKPTASTPQAAPLPSEKSDTDDLAAIEADTAKQNEANAVTSRIADDKLRMRDGFLFYRKYIDDAARLFADLPRRNYRSPFLGVKNGISVWSRTSKWADEPGLDLLAECDFLCDLNTLPAIGPERYRYIAVDKTSELTDATIASLTAWLRDTPGLLVVHGWLPTDNAAEVATVADLDGHLTADWPWEADIAVSVIEKPIVEKNCSLTGAAPVSLAQCAVEATYSGTGCESLWQLNGKTVAALWRKSDFAGAVLFTGLRECSGEYPAALRARVNELAQQGIGLALPEPGMILRGTDNMLQAAASASTGESAGRAAPVEGVDLLTACAAPTVGGGRNAAMVARDFAGRHVAAHAGITVLSEAPITITEQAENGFTVASAGLMQIGGSELSFTAGNAALAEQPLTAAWLFREKTDGRAMQEWQDAGHHQARYFVRSGTPVRVLRHAP